MEKKPFDNKHGLKLITVRNKIIAVVIGVTLVFAPFIFIYFPNKQKELLIESYNNEVKNIASTVALGVNVALIEQNFSGIEMAMQYAKSDPRLTFIALVQIDTVESDNGKTRELKKTVFSVYPEKYNIDLNIKSNDSILVKESTIRSEMLNGNVIVGFSTVSIQKIIAKVKATSFIGSFLISALGIIIGFLLARNISNPIKKLRYAHLRVGEGDLKQSVTVRSRDEIGDLAASFNQMVMKLDQAEKQLQFQKFRIEEKNREIMDSIWYAKRIQYSLLAKESLMNEKFPEHFIFFQPKDIVSGDFYWTHDLSNGQTALVVADSTGHGVPGSIMSLLNIFSLYEAVAAENLSSPAEILNYTRSKIIEHLMDDGSLEGGKDGMDCSLLCFDFKNKLLTYSAANNPVWIVRNKEIIQLLPDKMPVGKHDRDHLSFSQKEIQLCENDVIFAITDGMPDQFGGLAGKKFKNKALKDLFISISHLPMQEQCKMVSDAFNNWMGELEQVDDVTIVGIRI
jgi:serine phosphatase RsbU (regulator of sigma subunit)